jgi:SAM-dependent methyltransferase
MRSSCPNPTCQLQLQVQLMTPTSVDLGCGRSRRNPFGAEICIGVDMLPSEGYNDYHYCRLGIDRLPFSNDTIDYFTAFDVLEHIPRVLWRDGELINPFIMLMSEIHRCLKPAGIFYAETPAYPHSTAFQDPTHVNIITEETVFYFCPKKSPADDDGCNLLLKHGQNYGFEGEFMLDDQSWRGAHLIWRLSKSAI